MKILLCLLFQVIFFFSCWSYANATYSYGRSAPKELGPKIFAKQEEYPIEEKLAPPSSQEPIPKKFERTGQFFTRDDSQPGAFISLKTDIGEDFKNATMTIFEARNDEGNDLYTFAIIQIKNAKFLFPLVAATAYSNMMSGIHGTGFNYSDEAPASQDRIEVADIDGDGKKEIFLYFESGLWIYKYDEKRNTLKQLFEKGRTSGIRFGVENKIPTIRVERFVADRFTFQRTEVRHEAYQWDGKEFKYSLELSKVDDVSGEVSDFNGSAVSEQTLQNKNENYY